MELLRPWSGGGERTRLIPSSTYSVYGPAWAVTALRALVWSKAQTHFLGERRRKKKRKNLVVLSPKLTPGTDSDPWSMSSHRMEPRKNKWARLSLALLADPCLVSEFPATGKGVRDALAPISGAVLKFKC